MIDNDRYIDIIENYIKGHAVLTCRDLLKFCYQGCYGPRHLMPDKSVAYKYFLDEFKETPAGEGELTERISENYIRVNFAPYKKKNLPPEWLFEMFYYTAMEAPELSREPEEAFSIVEQVLEGKKDSISTEEWRRCVEEFLKEETPSVHHSEEYKAAENPHYRLISGKYEKMFPIFLLMTEKQGLEKKALTFEYHEDYTGELVAMPVESKKNEILILAIEGRAASGKSTLAAELARITKSPVIKMDHFFLPKSLQKPKRLKEPGGNIHYERFIEEVLSNIKEDHPFSYAIYDCQVGGPNGMEAIPATPWRIVEGVYSLHPKFGDYADVKVFVDVSPEEQMQRIRIRNGVELAKKFREEWIPMEEVYFHVNRHEKNVDYKYEGYDLPY